MNCTAEVLYHLGSKSTAPDVQVTVQGELRSTEEADKEFYNRIRSLEKELVAENIPGTTQGCEGLRPSPCSEHQLLLFPVSFWALPITAAAFIPNSDWDCSGKAPGTVTPPAHSEGVPGTAHPAPQMCSEGLLSPQSNPCF